ncbi:hypothetical protein PWT90_01187 [Aphanocladium album]|nr:hypothetical protein PWT90_01187 [Aphanocladium album]
MKLLFIFPALAVAFVPGYWQPLPGQAVHDLALVYGEAVTQLFKSPWNPSVPNVDLIFAEITYTVEYRTIPAAAAAASVSWETRGSSMFLKVPAGAAAAPATRPDNRMGPTSVAPAPAAPTTTSILWSTSMVTVTVMQPSSAPSTGPGVLPRIANVCSSCTIAFPDEFIFTCACGGKTIRGNMNDYIRNNQGKIEPGSKFVLY